MSTSQHEFVAQEYGGRAQDYVMSAVHGSGDDLDQVEEILRGMPGARVLDLACGGGHVSYRAAPHVTGVVACDITGAMLNAVTAMAGEHSLSNITVQQAAVPPPVAETSMRSLCGDCVGWKLILSDLVR